MFGGHGMVTKRLEDLADRVHETIEQIDNLTYGPITAPHQAQVVAAHLAFGAAAEALCEAISRHTTLCINQGRGVSESDVAAAIAVLSQPDQGEVVEPQED